jgi:O-antigen/teichoic acid export membrane protein
VFYFATKLSLCMSVFIGFLLIVWGKPFIVRWMGANYADAYLPMVVLTVAVLLDIGQSPSINLLYATFNHRFYTYMNLAEGVINLICSLVLVRFFGILGVALGTLIGALAIRIAIQPWWVCKAVGLRYGEYMRFIGWNLLCCGCLVCAVTSISAWGLRPDYNYLVVSAVCATVLYGTASWFIVFNGRERVQLLAAITNRSQQPSDDEAVVATQ